MLANVYFVPALSTVFAIIGVLLCRLLVVSIARTSLEKANAGPEAMAVFKSGKSIVNSISAFLIIAIIAIAVFSNLRTVAINETPQSTIDRSELDQKQEARDRALRKEAAE